MRESSTMQPQQAFIAPPCHEAVVTRFADCNLLVVCKPANLLSVPGRLDANKDSALLRLQREYGEVHTVHRLDMHTSGLMVFARNKNTLRELNAQFAKRQVHKRYHALLYGVLDTAHGRVDLPLACDWPNRPKQKVDMDAGKAALTHYQRIKTCARAQQSLVVLQPVTGRSHQLRVHMQAIGHPISGCEFYAHEQALQQASRLMLHASQLAFSDPRTGTKRVFDDPAPFDL